MLLGIRNGRMIDESYLQKMVMVGGGLLQVKLYGNRMICVDLGWILLGSASIMLVSAYIIALIEGGSI